MIVNRDEILKRLPTYVYYNKEDFDSDKELQSIYRRYFNNRNQKMTAQLKLRSQLQQQMINSVPVIDGISTLEYFDSGNEQQVIDILDAIAEGMNEAVNSSITWTNTLNSFDQIIQQKKFLRDKVTSSSNYNSNTLAKLDQILENIGNVFEKLYGIDKVTLLWTLQKTINRHPLSKQTPFGKYIMSQVLNTQAMVKVSKQAQAQAENLAAIIIQASYSNSPKTLLGQLSNYFGKETSKDLTKLMIAEIITEEGVNKPIKELISNINRKGKIIISDNSLDSSKTESVNSSIKKKNYNINLSMSGHTINGQFGFSDSFIKKGSTFYNPSTGRKEESQIRILNNSPVRNHVEQINQTPRFKGLVMNSFVHGEEFTEIIERGATISGLLGASGAGGRDGNLDLTMFFVSNGKFYSIYSVLDNMLKSNNWKENFSIDYSEQLDNSWKGHYSIMNIRDALFRSNSLENQFNNLLIKIQMNPRYLKTFLK